MTASGGARRSRCCSPELATLPWLPRTFRSHPGPQAVPSAGAAPLLRAAGFALLALALGGGFLWSAPAEAQEPAPNSPATGAATISGTMRVGETLTADVSGITDPDGLENASFSYQWIRNDGNADTYIQAAEQPTYRLEPDDEGKTIKVRVSFTDDRGQLGIADQRTDGGSAAGDAGVVGGHVHNGPGQRRHRRRPRRPLFKCRG